MGPDAEVGTRGRRPTRSTSCRLPATKMLTCRPDLASLEPDKEDGKLVFDHAPAILGDDSRSATIMVAGISPSTPHGFIRVVTDVARSGDSLALQTQGAPPAARVPEAPRARRAAASLDDGVPQPSGDVRGARRRRHGR